MQNAIDVLWENFYYTKPLTFWEFVQEFKSLKSLFPCVKDALKRFDESTKMLSTYPSEIYVQGAVGIGKGVYCYLVFLYRVYLFLLLKEPHKLMSWAPSAEIGAVVIGPRADETLKGIVNFIQSAESNIFGIGHEYENNDKKVVSEIVWSTKDENTTDLWLEKGLDGKFYFKAKNGNKLVFEAVTNQVGLMGLQPAINYFESDDYDLYCSLVTRVQARFGLQNKVLFSTIIVDKFPNNLYSDLLDQTIKEKEKEANVLVERFVYYFYKNVENEEFWKDKHDYMIDPDTGKVERKDAENVEGLNWICFPGIYKSTTCEMNLYEMAKKNPEAFIKDILGLPLTTPLSKEYKVTDELSALQTVRKLIKDYHIKITYGNDGMYLAIDEVNTKIKVY